METYLSLLEEALHDGTEKPDRTGTGTRSLFGRQMRFDLRAGLPVVTTREIHLRSVIGEMLWFLRGDTTLDYLHEHEISIWDEWADEDGDLGPVYGAQWRSWPTPEGGEIDQLKQVIERLQTHPHSRRHLVSAWNVAELDEMALPPCHVLFQFYVAEGRLSCQLYQRSADIFLGLPFNITSYAILTSMIAHVAGLEPGEFVHTLGDAHLYQNHLDQTRRQLDREPYERPELELAEDVECIDDFELEDVEVLGYRSHSPIEAPVAV